VEEQAIQGLAQDMWVRLESEAKVMWTGLNEYRGALEDSARSTHESRIHGHEQVIAPPLLLACHSSP